MNFIYATNATTQTPSSGDVIALTTITRRYGDIALANNAAALLDAGWYNAQGQITFTSTAGAASLSVYQDGQPIAGATASVTAEASTLYTLNVQGVVKKTGCRCSQSNVYLVNTGATTLTISNAALFVEKL